MTSTATASSLTSASFKYNNKRRKLESRDEDMARLDCQIEEVSKMVRDIQGSMKADKTRESLLLKIELAKNMNKSAEEIAALQEALWNII